MKILKEFAKRAKISFPLLADEQSKTIEAWGIRNKDAKGSRIDGVPHPGTFLIGKDGTVRAKLFYSGYKKRHHADDIIEAQKKAASKRKAA